MVTRRDCSAITKKTRYRWSPASVSTSTVNRSQAVRPSRAPARTSSRAGAGSAREPGRSRGCAGSASPGSERSRGRGSRAPRGSVCPPHWGCSTATRTTSAATARRVIGRPRPRRALPSYVWAINLRYQRRIVSGVTMRRPASRRAGRVAGRARRVDGVGHRSGEAAEGPGTPGGPDAPPGDTRSDRLGGGSPSQRT